MSASELSARFLTNELLLIVDLATDELVLDSVLIRASRDEQHANLLLGR